MSYYSREQKKESAKMKTDALIAQARASGATQGEVVVDGKRYAFGAETNAPTKKLHEMTDAEIDALPAEVYRALANAQDTAEREAAEKLVASNFQSEVPKYSDEEISRMTAAEYREKVVEPTHANTTREQFDKKVADVRAWEVPYARLLVAIGLQVGAKSPTDKRVLQHDSYLTPDEFRALTPDERNTWDRAVNAILKEYGKERTGLE
jgi:hypothetical protein